MHCMALLTRKLLLPDAILPGIPRACYKLLSEYPCEDSARNSLRPLLQC